MIESQEFTKYFSLKQLGLRKSFSQRIPKLLSLGFGIILISWLLSQVDFSAAHLILQNISLIHLFAGFFFYGVSFYLRSIRFNLLLPTGKPLRDMFPIVLVHYTALNIIPARLGELSYVYLLKKLHQVPAGSSVSSLLLARIFDQISISIIFLISLGFVEVETPWLKTMSWTVGGLLISSVICLLLILSYKKQSLYLLKKILQRFGIEHYTITQRIIRFIEEVLIGFNEIESQKRQGRVLALSLTIWMSILSVNYTVFTAFQVHLSYSEIILSSTFLILLTVLPFQVFSGLGVRSLTWTVVAGAMGVPENIAIVSALGSRIITTFYLVGLGAYGLWRISRESL